jgi:hypothetical protein
VNLLFNLAVLQSINRNRDRGPSSGLPNRNVIVAMPMSKQAERAQKGAVAVSKTAPGKGQKPKKAPVPQDDIFAVLQKRLEKTLVGFSSELPESWRHQALVIGDKPSREDFPLPDLVMFALATVLGYPSSGPEEKTRWSVFALFNGVTVSFELRKFGFTICQAKGAAVDMKRLRGQLRVAVKHVEQWLQLFATKQIQANNLTIANRNSKFDHRYRFFRDLADKAYRGPLKQTGAKANATKAVPKALADALESWNDYIRSSTDGVSNIS